MTYPHSWSGQRPMESSTAQGANWPYFTDPPDHRRASTAVYCARAVLLLGLATYLVSYGAVREPGGMGWGFRFSTLAAVVAALGLLPRQAAHAKLVAVLAVPAFLESLSRWASASTSHDPKWIAVGVVVLTALQASAAIAALLTTEVGVQGTPDHRPAPYDPYVYYAQIAQQYYAPSVQDPQQDTAPAQESVQAQTAAGVQAPASAAARDALYAEYVSAQQPGAIAAMPSPRAGGPAQAAHATPGSGLPTTGPADGARPKADPARQSPTEAPPA